MATTLSLEQTITFTKLFPSMDGTEILLLSEFSENKIFVR